MNVICSPAGSVDMKFPRKGIRVIKESGFLDVLADFSLLFLNQEIEDEKLYQDILDQFFTICKEESIPVKIAYAPYNMEKQQEKTSIFDYIKHTIIACGKAACEYLVIRPLTKETLEKESISNKEYYLHVFEIVKKYKTKILIENQYRDFNGHYIRGVCSDASEAADFIEKLNTEVGENRFGFCMNLGNSNLCSQNPYEWIKVMGKYLKAVIIRDCDGNSDNALLPYSCTNRGIAQTSWTELLRGLREIEFEESLIMNFSSTIITFPSSLRLELMKFAKKIADYFVWQIGVERKLNKYTNIVLFGAGNMCKNYMNTYGKKKVPLFTCDNNPSLWGKKIYGLEVKEPSALLTLEKNCAIFICNMYYQEIEEQLQDMGINNPMERFTDENMTMLQLGFTEG